MESLTWRGGAALDLLCALSGPYGWEAFGNELFQLLNCVARLSLQVWTLQGRAEGDTYKLGT